MNETRVKIQESLREMEAHKVLALIGGVDGYLAPVYLIRRCIHSGEAVSSSEWNDLSREGELYIYVSICIYV